VYPLPNIKGGFRIMGNTTVALIVIALILVLVADVLLRCHFKRQIDAEFKTLENNRVDFVQRFASVHIRLEALEDNANIKIPLEKQVATEGVGYKVVSLHNAVSMIGSYLNLGYRVVEATPSVASLVKGKKKKRG
jgi:hypothetical protein